MSSLSKHNPKQEKLLTVALTVVALLVSAPSPARAVNWLDTLSQTLGQQGGGVISEFPSTGGGGGVISEFPSTGGGGGVISEFPSTGGGGGVISEFPSTGGGGGVISEFPSTGGGGGGVISESGQSGVGTAIGGAAQNGADNVINGGVGQIGGAIGGIFGNRGGVVGQFLNPFEQLMQKYIGAAQVYLHDAVSKLLGAIFGNVGGGGAPGPVSSGGPNGTTANDVISEVGANVPPGAMGLPDFAKVKTEIEDKTKSGANGAPSTAAQKVDRFNLNPIALSRSLSAEQDRTLGRTIAASVLSDEGQQAMVEERAAAAQTLKQIQAKAQEAQGMDVTQDVMKNLAQMVAGQSSLESGSYAQTMLVHQQLSANGLVESNISEALDEANRTRHVEAMAGASKLMQSASSVYLPGS